MPGVYTDWGSAESQIRGWKAPRFKAFPTYAEAEAFVKGNGTEAKTSPSAQPQQSISSPSPAPVLDDIDFPSAKRRKTGSESSVPVARQGSVADRHLALGQQDQYEHEAGEGPLPLDAQDGFDPRITLNPVTGKVEYKSEKHLNQMKWQATNQTDNTPVKIYTDGSSLGNGAHGAVAGVGVYFGPRHPDNLSEALIGPRQTNQRAELTAIQRALELSPRNRPLQIITDSNYSIKCVTEWFIKWRQNGWLNSAKKPVENKDLIEKIINLLEQRQRIGASRTKVEFVWVKGHANDPGNVAADELAVSGARQAKELIASGVVPLTNVE